MKPEYDIFERFSDGSTIWRAYVCGKYEAQRRIAELSEHSENQFYAIDLRNNKALPFDLVRTRSQPATNNLKRTG